MSNFKCSASSVSLFFLLACFSAVMAHADAGQRSLVAEQNLFAWQANQSDLSAGNDSPPGRNGLASAEQISSGEKQARSKTMKIIGEIWGGLLGNALGGLLGAGALLAGEGDSSSILYFGGSALGSALGVYLAGHSDGDGGKFSMAFLGSVLGELAAFGLFTSRDDGISLIPALLFPVIGAVVGYNISITSRSLPKGSALLNLNEGKLVIGIPQVKIRRMRAKYERAEPAFGFNVRIFSVGL